MNKYKMVSISSKLSLMVKAKIVTWPDVVLNTEEIFKTIILLTGEYKR